MPVQIKFDLQTREKNIQKILQSFKTRASVKTMDVEKMFDDFKDHLEQMDDKTRQAFRQLKYHYYIGNLQEVVQDDDLESIESGDIALIGDTVDAEKEVIKSVIGAYVNE